MSSQLLSPAIETLKTWHTMIDQRDLARLHSIVHPKAVFRSPAAHTPYQGREALILALSTVIEVFENFTYHRQFVSEDGDNAALEFSATVNGKELKGIDLIRFDAQGQIVDFEVMVRPASGLMALGEEMGKRVGPRLKDYQ